AREQYPGTTFRTEILGRAVPVKNTKDGMRAIQGGKAIAPSSVEHYLEDKFGDNLKAVRSAMEQLAKAYRPKELAREAYSLYETFRPAISSVQRGWGATGELDLGLIERLATERRTHQSGAD